MTAELLPSNFGAFERAIAQAMTDDLPVPFVQIMDPYQTPLAFLPFLAAHHSVDLWFEDWSEARKREIVAQYAGVSTLYPGESLPELKGTHEGALRYLAFVDATVLDRVTYPARFVFGSSSVSFTPINHPAFKSRWLVKMALEKPVNALVFGRSAWGLSALRTVDLEPVRRLKQALFVAKAPETEYLISTAWRRPATFSDVILDGQVPIGSFVDRAHL